MTKLARFSLVLSAAAWCGAETITFDNETPGAAPGAWRVAMTHQ
jgi:hypothetical protein